METYEVEVLDPEDLLGAGTVVGHESDCATSGACETPAVLGVEGADVPLGDLLHGVDAAEAGVGEEVRALGLLPGVEVLLEHGGLPSVHNTLDLRIENEDEIEI